MFSLRIYFFKDRTVLAMAALALMAIVGSWLLIAAVPRPLAEDPFVVLQYTVYFGIQRLGDWPTLFWFPGVGSAIAIIHSIAAYVLYDRDRFLSYVLMIGGALGTVILFFVSLFMLTVNV
ncbi:MAG: hypothetical protein HZB10_04055 [Candidatus Yonathbacteria bacterium]|nr:hypothetical protein [Candidatus Yonathbacteria bacterium]